MLGVYRMCIVILWLCRLLLREQAAYWLLSSGAAFALVHSGAGRVQSQTSVLLQDNAGRGKNAQPTTSVNGFREPTPHTKIETCTKAEHTNEKVLILFKSSGMC